MLAKSVTNPLGTVIDNKPEREVQRRASRRYQYVPSANGDRIGMFRNTSTVIDSGTSSQRPTALLVVVGPRTGGASRPDPTWAMQGQNLSSPTHYGFRRPSLSNILNILQRLRPSLQRP